MAVGMKGAILHKLGEVKENPIRLDKTYTKQMCDSTNVLLSSVYTLYHQIKKHHWIVEGPDFRDLHLMLDELAANLLKIGDQLAERITVLAGYPVSTPQKQQEMCLFEVEEEGGFELRVMLGNDMRAYEEMIVRYRDVIRQAIQANDFGSEEMLKEQLAVLEFDVHHIEHVLGDDTLTTKE